MKEAESQAHREKRHLREQKELKRRQQDLAKPLPKLYLYYLFLVVSLAYIVDEIASNIANQFQSNIVTDFFLTNTGMLYDDGLTLYQLLGTLCSLPLLLVLIYKPLAEKKTTSILGDLPKDVLLVIYWRLGTCLFVFESRESPC